MKCKACKREIPEESIFCLHCGEKQIKTREKKKEISVPKPRQLKSGTWFGQIEYKGKRSSVSAPTEAEWYTKARAVKLGLIEAEKSKQGLTLEQACNNYIDARSGVLSPATISGYKNIIRNRFKSYMKKDLLRIDWQKMVNAEAALCNAKTLKNSVGFVRSVLKANGIVMPNVTLPQLIPNELPWLTPEQIPLFLAAIKDKPCEMAALFALRGLRRSEFLALRPMDIVDGVINIRASRVPDSNNNLVYKPETKNLGSRRSIKVKIPRLQELIDASTVAPDDFYISTNPNTIFWQVNQICEKAGLPKVGLHGLRRSFASLAYSLGLSERETMQEGGWSDYGTMHKRYIKLAESSANADDSISDFFKGLQNTNKIPNEE